jgi:hypothetical protein
MRRTKKRLRMDDQIPVADPADAHAIAPGLDAVDEAKGAMLKQREVALVVGGKMTPKLDTEKKAASEYLHNMTSDSHSSDSGIICSDVSTMFSFNVYEDKNLLQLLLYFLTSFSFQVFEVSMKETIATAEEGYINISSDDEDSAAEKYLFCSNVPMGENLALGFGIVASHDFNFGKLYLRLLSEKRTLLLRNYSMFLQLFSLPLAEKKKLLGKNGKKGFYGIGDVTISFTKDGSMSLFCHSKTFGGNIEFLTLSPQELDSIESFIEALLDQRLHFEIIEKVTGEAINDINFKCRMFAQGDCVSCKEMDSNLKPNTCTSIRGDCLDSVLRNALSLFNVRPLSRAIEQIYNRLSKHTVYFKQEFRRSVEWNKNFDDLYKTADLPLFLFLE